MKDKKKSKKFNILILAVVILVVIGIVTIMIVNNNNKNKGNNDNNIDEEIMFVTGKAVEEKSTNDYKLSDIKMLAKLKETEITITVKNISSSTLRRKGCIY